MADRPAKRNSDRIAKLYAAEPQIRAAVPLDSVSEAIRAPGLGLPRIVQTLMEGYADRPALGWRATELETDPDSGRRRQRLRPDFETISYGELGNRVRAVAAAWHDGERAIRPGDFIAILGFTSVDYTVLDLAAVWLGAVVVPLQASASRAQLRPILDETEPSVLAASVAMLDHAVELAIDGAAQGRIVVFDYHTEDDEHREAIDSARRKLAGSDIALETLDAVIARGRRLPAPEPYVAPEGEDPLSLLIYTSGSTGTPKGAMYTERLVTSMWLAQPLVAAINVNFSPLSHVLGRMALNGTLARGGTTYFTARSDLSMLFEDIASVRPTELVLVPRVCEMLFQHFQSELDKRPTDTDRAALERKVKAELRESFLGGRVMSVTCGSAPLAPETKSFVESVLDLRVHDIYGSTEAGGGVVINNRIRRPPVVDYKLVDVPELGYFGTDKPYPRGELLLKTTTLIPGYYKRPDITAEIYDEDGFYRTGDVVAETGPDELIYVDRRNNVLKLSQGEFVTVAKLEAAFANSPLVHQIYVYGSSERAYLLAVIVPAQSIRADEPQLLRRKLQDSLQWIARDAELESYEIPRDFLIETEPFTTANGLLSGIGKILRPKLKERYGERLEQLYAELAAAQNDELLALRRNAGELSTLETVSRATCAVLGCPRTDVRPESRFIDLGGDSLAALSLSNLLRDIFGIELPVGEVTGPTSDLRTLAEFIDAERESGGKRPSISAVHAATDKVYAAELQLEKFIDPATLAEARSLPRPSGEMRTVLLTGANGYLGRFLCLEWLQRVSSTGGTVICIVRGADAATARERLEAAFDSGDADLIRRFDDLARDHLEVIPGDVGAPDLGVDQQTWRRLATDVDVIVHSAALVNHVLPYRQLFGPNVVGTAEVVRLAVTERLKPVAFLSTVAVGAQAAALDEAGDIREISPAREVNATYANGYGNSKWASEVLLREAHDLCGLPVDVFRSDMILAHSRFAGQLNVPDMFTRLLLSVLATGVAPGSFYRTDRDGNRRRAHYDGLPADFTAAAITELGAQAGSEFRTFNVLNPHDDDVSLDRFVDWLIEDGQHIHRIDDYEQWRNRFEGALRTLPERQRQNSLLPLMHAFARPGQPTAGSPVPAERFRDAVREAGLGDIPHLTRDLVVKYVTDLRLRGLLV